MEECAMSTNLSDKSDPHTSRDEALKEIDRRVKIGKFAIFGEFLFILLPLIVISIVELFKGQTILTIIESPEWSFGTAIMFGQSITKLVAGFSRTKPKTWEKPVFLVSAITVIGLVPTLIIFALLLCQTPPNPALKIAQLAMFCFGIVIFFLCGIGGHIYLHQDSEVRSHQ
jgi:hypothetical protein